MLTLLRALLLSLIATQLGAQESRLRPLSQHLAEAADDSVETMRYVTRRCSGLYSLVSDQYDRRRDPGTAEMYLDWSLGFVLAAARADIELGSSPEQAVHDNGVAITQITERLRERMNRTRSLGEDRLLSSDVRTCRIVVDELGLAG